MIYILRQSLRQLYREWMGVVMRGERETYWMAINPGGWQQGRLGEMGRFESSSAARIERTCSRLVIGGRSTETGKE